MKLLFKLTVRLLTLVTQKLQCVKVIRKGGRGVASFLQNTAESAET